ncbi:hypothetical protein M427DRAFT_28149 [Gonapodya prolifera JEL478]|uniref:Uncharacterized protein n=1 Tax=Gonapodya prolifera (strain JEL478) TaxID=1344416 RepID=A0A139AUL2_GONPJ|nr:hypothetical protein M427DRAFT_28149 [Gonapodya prolifera JEL478]|eukprot:KXS20421.1 hypothetical protein M427DRAFT_28149 [Gonapodya prolifera JEL478]
MSAEGSSSPAADAAAARREARRARILAGGADRLSKLTHTYTGTAPENAAGSGEAGGGATSGAADGAANGGDAGGSPGPKLSSTADESQNKKKESGAVNATATNAAARVGAAGGGPAVGVSKTTTSTTSTPLKPAQHFPPTWPRPSLAPESKDPLRSVQSPSFPRTPGSALSQPTSRARATSANTTDPFAFVAPSNIAAADAISGDQDIDVTPAQLASFMLPPEGSPQMPDHLPDLQELLSTLLAGGPPGAGGTPLPNFASQPGSGLSTPFAPTPSFGSTSLLASLLPTILPSLFPNLPPPPSRILATHVAESSRLWRRLHLVVAFLASLTVLWVFATSTEVAEWGRGESEDGVNSRKQGWAEAVGRVARLRGGDMVVGDVGVAAVGYSIWFLLLALQFTLHALRIGWISLTPPPAASGTATSSEPSALTTILGHGPTMLGMIMDDLSVFVFTLGLAIVLAGIAGAVVLV